MNRSGRTYDLDGYGRYVEEDGERYAVEPYPYWKPFGPRVLWRHLTARFGVLRWFWGTRDRRDLWRY